MLMNLGGPESLDKVQPFLTNLFLDEDIFDVPFQKIIGPLIAKRRTPSVINDYKEIGGKSPIREWTEMQGKGMVKILDELSPKTSPHNHFTCFRYSDPLTEEAVDNVIKSGIKKLIIFSQYPQYSCTTIGSSLNQLRRTLQEKKLDNHFDISIIDTWGTHPSYIKAVSTLIKEALEKIPQERRSKAVILFSAHSVPSSVVDKGDRYPMEVSETVSKVMDELKLLNPHRLSWQSKVGPLPWLGPQLENVIKDFPKIGVKDIVVVPIAFTSDHIETLFEIDITYGDLAKKVGINMVRCESLNDHPLFLKAMADIVNDHMKNGSLFSNQFMTKCSGCSYKACEDTRQFFSK